MPTPEGPLNCSALIHALIYKGVIMVNNGLLIQLYCKQLMHCFLKLNSPTFEHICNKGTSN